MSKFWGWVKLDIHPICIGLILSCSKALVLFPYLISSSKGCWTFIDIWFHSYSLPVQKTNLGILHASIKYLFSFFHIHLIPEQVFFFTFPPLPPRLKSTFVLFPSPSFQSTLIPIIMKTVGHATPLSFFLHSSATKTASILPSQIKSPFLFKDSPI